MDLEKRVLYGMSKTLAWIGVGVLAGDETTGAGLILSGGLLAYITAYIISSKRPKSYSQAVPQYYLPWKF